MLSTEVRKKAEFICSRIAEKAEVPVSDMIWIQKWAKSNHSVESMLRRARRRAMRGDQPAEGLDRFLEDMDLGEVDPLITFWTTGPVRMVCSKEKMVCG